MKGQVNASKKRTSKRATKTRKTAAKPRKAPARLAKKPQARKAATKKRASKKATYKRAKPVGQPGPPIAPPTDAVGFGPTGTTNVVLTWEDDPDSVPARMPIQVSVPTLPTGNLAITIVDAAPPAQVHPPGTSRFRYWTAAEALTRGMTFWSRFLPNNTQWSTPNQQLVVHLDLGVDLNAYYRRGASRLEFYHSTVGGKTVFSGESPSVVCHELGHAVLDAIRPQLFNAANVESAAFHESFGDMSAILCSLQLNSVAETILNETGGGGSIARVSFPAWPSNLVGPSGRLMHRLWILTV